MDYSFADLVASQPVTFLIYSIEAVQLQVPLPPNFFGSISIAEDTYRVKEVLIHASVKPDRHHIGILVERLSKGDPNKQEQTLVLRLFLFCVFQTSRVTLAVLRQLLRGLDILRHRV